MSTVKEAITMLNETLHPQGYHVGMVPLNMMCYDDMLGGDGYGDAEHNLIKQTYDFRYNKPDKENYTVTLSNKDMQYIGRAMELYHRVCFDRYEKEMKEVFKRMITKMDDAFKEDGDE